MIQQVAVALDVDPDWLKYGGQRTHEADSGYALPAQAPVRLVGRGAADDSGGAFYDLEQPSGYLDLGRNIGAVEIIGNSLAPVALRGQHVLVDLGARTPRDGDLVVLETMDGRMLTKRYYSRDDGGAMLVTVNAIDSQPPISLRPSQVKQIRVIVAVLFESRVTSE